MHSKSQTWGGVHALVSLMILLSFLKSAYGVSVNYTIDLHGDVVTARSSPVLEKRNPLSEMHLVIMAVGDSITAGVGSNDGNSYRLDLANRIKADSPQTTLDFIGTQTDGENNPDNQHEGYGGYRIGGILDRLQGDGILRSQPNLVLIHAGTNDNNAETDTEKYADAPARLGGLIDYILCHDPDAVVLVAELVQNKYNPSQTDFFNSQIPSLVGDRYVKGYKIRVVDMTDVQGDELSDVLHPNAAGYKHMADLWWEAMANIPSDWWTASNPANAQGSVQTCARDAIGFLPALSGKNVAAGAHVAGDPPEPLSGPGNTLSPHWSDHGVVAIGIGRDGSGVHMADLDGDGRADYLWVDPDTCSVRAWLNEGEAIWHTMNGGNEIAFGTGRAGYVQFADLNGDKRVEYIVVDNGHFKVYTNNGRSNDIWLWGINELAAQQLENVFGGQIGYHLFGDMNGDGRADLCVINANGVLDFYIQQGTIGTDGFSWQKCPNKGILAGSRMMLVDVDGDGRDDYMSVDEDGGVRGWLNKPGGDCDITWVPINGGGPKSVALLSAPSGQVRMADFDGDGKVDYIVVDDDTGALRLHVNDGKNVAAESSSLGGYGAALRLADLNGDGKDDYLSVSQKTEVLAYLNGGELGGGWAWNIQGKGNVIALGDAGSTRHQIQFADMNGDGLDDYLIINDDTGGVECYLNGGPSGDSWSWLPQGIIALGAGKPGEGVRFADMDGDGRADYIYLDEAGAATVWINQGPYNVLNAWSVLNNGAVSALGVGAKRQDVQFADIDGDGRADYLWVHPESGAVEVWYNGGPLGDALGWIHGGTIATGVGLRGPNTRFARIGSSGRADYVAVEEKTGAFRVWYNSCSKVIGSSGGNLDGELCGKPPRDAQDAPELPPLPECNPDNPEPECVIGIPTPKCFDGKRYNTIDDVQNDKGIPEACVNTYLLHAMSQNMTASLDSYRDIMEHNYKKKYDAFIRRIHIMGINSYDSNIWPHKSTYWDCVTTKDGKNVTIDCWDPPWRGDSWWIRKPDFCEAIDRDANIDCNWLRPREAPHDDASDNSLTCQRGGECKHDIVGTLYYEDLNPRFEVPDPSEIISDAINVYQDFSGWLSDTAGEAQIQWFTESVGDVVDASALTVLSVDAAAQAMAEVAEIGEQELEAERKQMIEIFITAFLILIPGAGEALAAASGIAWIGRLARLADVAGNTALEIYSIVENPESAPAAAAGILFGGLASRNDFAWGKAATKARGIEASVLKKMGNVVDSGMGKVRGLCKQCIEV